LRSLQLILQATHGVVSGAPAFFKRAFGDSVESFDALLLRPHRYIFNREWYERLSGRAEFGQYQREFRKLSSGQRRELLALLSSCEPRQIKTLVSEASDLLVRKIIRYYIPLSKAREAEIWAGQRKILQETASDIPEDERVEDAGLSEPVLLTNNRSATMTGAVQ